MQGRRQLLLRGPVYVARAPSSLHGALCVKLPSIYKMVCSKKLSLSTPIRQPRRRSLSTSLKKIATKLKYQATQEEFKCAFCDFCSVSNVKVIKHMKSYHTQDSGKVLAHENEKNLNTSTKDMSICILSDDDDESTDKTEELLSEIKSCTLCTFEAKEEVDLEQHNDENHAIPQPNLDEVITVAPQAPKPLPLYKCNDCVYATITTDELKEHKKNKHSQEKPIMTETVFMHTCITCGFETYDYNKHMQHIDKEHRIHVARTSPTFSCDVCNFESTSNDYLNEHVNTENRQKQAEK